MAALALILSAMPGSAAYDSSRRGPQADTVRQGEVDPNGAKTDEGSPAAPEPAANDKPDDFTPKAGAIYEWSLQTPDVNNKRNNVDASTDLTTAPTDEDIPYAGWAACGFRDDRFKVVHDYTRLTVHPRQERNYTRLYCGLFEDDLPTHAFGYRHILDGHAGDWQRKADYINRNWRDLAGWAMSYTFKDPDATYIQPTRFCYQRKFFLYYGDTKVSEMRAIMYLGETGVRIMTAYPVNTATCNGTKL